MELIVRRSNKRIYRRGQDCVKLFESGVSVADILSGATNQARAQEAGLPVPRLHEVTILDGKWAVVSDFVEGETLMQRMEAEPGNPAWMELFIQLQMQVLDRYISKLQSQNDKFRRKIAASGLCATTRYELITRLDAMPNQKLTCHGDFIPSNVILQGDCAYILDWNQLTAGNAAADAANTYITMQKYGHADLAERYLKQFCDISDTAQQYVRNWVPIVAAAALGDCPENDREFYKKLCEGVCE